MCRRQLVDVVALHAPSQRQLKRLPGGARTGFRVGSRLLGVLVSTHTTRESTRVAAANPRGGALYKLRRGTSQIGTGGARVEHGTYPDGVSRQDRAPAPDREETEQDGTCGQQRPPCQHQSLGILPHKPLKYMTRIDGCI